MFEKPTGTLFIRPSTSHNGRPMVGVFGLVSMSDDIEGERLYLGAFQRVGDQLRFGLESTFSQKPEFYGRLTDEEDLAGLAQSSIWRGGPEARGSCLVFVRRSGLKPVHGYQRLYLVVAVVSDTGGIFEGLGEQLVDLNAGRQLGPSTPAKSAGRQPQQVLRQPFFLMPEGDRRAVVHTVGPKTRRVMIDVSEICTKPVADRSASEVARIEEIRRDPELHYHLHLYEKPSNADFQAYARGMRAMPRINDRLVTAQELADRDAFSAKLMRSKLDAAA